MTEGIQGGDIWTIRFDPSEGDEIQKIRPAVVMTASGAGKIRLQIVVPITGRQPQFSHYFCRKRQAEILHLDLEKIPSRI